MTAALLAQERTGYADGGVEKQVGQLADEAEETAERPAHCVKWTENGKHTL
jgi:hypothetical protein